MSDKKLDEKNVKLSFPQRLQRGITAWQKMAEPALAHRIKLLSYYAGGFFEDKNHTEHIMNLTARAVDIIAPYLVMNNPEVIVESRVPSLKPWAYTTKLALEHLFNEIDFANLSLRPAIINSLFGQGIIKTGVMKADEVEAFGYLHDVGQPYSDVIDDSDYVGDCTARTREQFEFEGHRYKLPTDFARDFFGSKHADHIKPDFSLKENLHHPELLAKQTPNMSLYDSLYEWSEFYDIWLPREDVIVTIQSEGKGSRILRTVEWDGPEGGPFDILKYKFFPNTPIPIPPTWYWMMMDTMTNILVNKMRRQAEREKSILAYEPVAEEDAANIAGAPDGGTVKVDNIDAIKEVQFGGVNDMNYKWVEYIENQYSIQGGNLYTLGGRGPQADTLGQEQMMQANASRILDDMMNSVYTFVQKVVKKQAWFMWTDPLIQIPVIKRVPHAADIEVMFDQVAKEGDFYDFNFEIKPYSMQRMNPFQRQQLLQQFLTNWVLPILPMASQQGVNFDFDAATREMALLLGINMDDWWQSGNADNTGLGPYRPTEGQAIPKSGQENDSGGASLASRMTNLNQQQVRAGGQSSPPQK
jgi:hypothetical protein